MRSIWVVTLVVLGGLGTARADDAVDYIKDAKLFYRVVACRGSDPLPPGIDTATVDKHCAEQNKRYEALEKRYLKPAAEFFAPLRPAKLPTTVVYAFGGGDLMSALLTYPDAREITTISLEHAGDPTRLAGLDKPRLAVALQAYRDASSGLLTLHDSTSENMRKLEKGGIPGQLSFHITGMAVMGYEPVSLKFFKLNTDGTLHYYTQTEIEALAKSIAKKVKYGWVDTDFSEAFNNMELTIRKAGDPKAPLIVHRHFAANLANKPFVDTGLEKHLVAKGKIAALTKAASYLIHDDGFTKVRDYLLANMVWMPSDSTGIDPRAAKKAGFEQVTYGAYKGAFLKEANVDVANAMMKLWSSQPYRKLPFRYGYPDSDSNIHLMITQPASPPEPKK
ncbi:MAG: hypothetical protein KF773_04665 [Deltaproteobacteria bacterium]|nr:hypothetical protein [Deltaproteobacteria bacterium]